MFRFSQDFYRRHQSSVKLYHGDCLEIMKKIPDNSVDLILCDLPYNTTGLKWDKIITFDQLWIQYNRILSPLGTAVFTAAMPFTILLGASNLKQLKYSIVWKKSKVTGHIQAKNKPMKAHEDILVFSKGATDHITRSKNRMVYNPQGLTILKKPYLRKTKDTDYSEAILSKRPSHKDVYRLVKGYPNSIIEIKNEPNVLHPTQKPVALMEYLIKTYSNEGDTVLDNCMGSGTTGIACLNTNRQFIGIEKDDIYFKIARNRILTHRIPHV